MEILNKYTRPAIILHWLMAGFIFLQLALGWYMEDLPKSMERSNLFAIHKSLGISIFALLLIRLAWRHTHHPPPWLITMPHWQRQIAIFSHRGLYLFILIQALSGYLSSSFSGYRTAYFGLPLPYWGWKDPYLNALLTNIHALSAILFSALLSLHILAALRHLFIARDSTFQRMLP
jgi:cytochrome b561